MRTFIPFLPLFLLLSACDLLEPGEKPIPSNDYYFDFDQDGRSDVSIQRKLTVTADNPTSNGTDVVQLTSYRGATFLNLGGQAFFLPPGYLIGPANSYDEFLKTGTFPYWSPYDVTLALTYYHYRKGIVEYRRTTGDTGVYIGVRLETDTEPLYGWIKVKSKPVIVNGEYGFLTILQGYAFGKPGEPIRAGEYPS